MTNNPKSTTGGEFDLTKEQFKVQSNPALTGFDFQAGSPPWPMYVDLLDQLFVSYIQTVPNNTFTVNVRMMGLDGEVKDVPFVFPINNSRTPTIAVRPLMEGFILGVNAISTGVSLIPTPFYVMVGLVRGGTGVLNVHTTLCAGYVNSQYGVSYPTTAPIRPIDGPGFVHSTVITQPAAGADFTFTVPTGTRLRIVSLTATFTAAVAVANRFIALIIDDGANVVATINYSVAVVAATAVTITFGDSLPNLLSASGQGEAPLPGNTIIPSGFRIRSSTAGIQAADQWSAITMLVHDWCEPL